MALVALLSRDPAVSGGLAEQVGDRHRVVLAAARNRLWQYLLNRPISLLLLDLEALARGVSAGEALRPFREGFPRTPIVVLARPGTEPALLFDLGRAGVRHLILVQGTEWDRSLGEVLADAAEDTPPALVARRMAPYLPARPLRVLRAALESVHRRPTADEFAASVGYSRPFLSACLKEVGLPSVGHLLIWARLFHAGHWLEEPARSGESVARQLEYYNGAGFRRALKRYTGATPTEVALGGGLAFVLQRFTDLLARSRSGGGAMPSSPWSRRVAGGRGS